MAAEKNKFPLVDFFTSLFQNFPRLLLTNLLFAIPFFAFFALFYFINSAAGINSNQFLMLCVIPIFPFYAGVTLVTSHMVRNEGDLKVVETFFRGIKENFLRFLVHAIILYAAIFFSYSSILLYSSFAKTSPIFYVFMVISILIAIFFLFLFFYVPPMTVTFDISMKNIYKNSALMSFGEIKHNLIATFGVLVLLMVFLTVLFCFTDALLIVIITAVLALLLAPSLISFIINSAVYGRMYSMIVDRTSMVREIDRKIEENKAPKKVVKEEDFSDVVIDEGIGEDEYIFYNGKMIKKSVLVSMKEQASKESN